MPTPAVTLATTLASGGLGTVGVNIFNGPVRPQGTGIPHKAIFCLGSGGPTPTPYMGKDTDFRRFAVQVRVRGNVGNFSDGLSHAQNAWEATQRATITGYVACFARDSDPIYLGQDDQEHHEWVFNVELWWKG